MQSKKNTEHRKKVLHRLKIAKGHLQKVIQMLEDDEYCLDIVHQSLAVQSALKKADHEILKEHMQTCVANSIRQGKDKEVIDEVMKVMKKI